MGEWEYASTVVHTHGTIYMYICIYIMFSCVLRGRVCVVMVVNFHERTWHTSPVLVLLCQEHHARGKEQQHGRREHTDLQCPPSL